MESETKPDSMKDDEWKNAVKKAKVLFSQAVDIDLIMECDSSFDMMKLDNLFVKKSEAKQLLSERKLRRLRYDESNAVDY